MIGPRCLRVTPAFALALLTAFASVAEATQLSYTTTFSTDANDTLANQLWSSDGQGTLHHVLLGTISDNEDYAPGDPSLNEGVSANSPFFTFPEGLSSTTFTVFMDGGSVQGNWGLNLFFDGQTSPSITGITDNPTSFPPAGSSLRTTTNNTFGGANGFNIPGAGTLTASVNGAQITLTDFQFSPAQLVRDSGLDLDPSWDFVAQFTLEAAVPVAPIPEPSTFAMAGTALALLGLGYARRRRRQASV